MGFPKLYQKEFMIKTSILYNSPGGVPHNRSRNFNRRHHQYLDTRKSSA